MLDFVAIDFETANSHKNSACSLAAVTVESGVITKKTYHLIKPPFMQFDAENIEVHGIQPQEVLNEPYFDTLWRDVFEPELDGKILVAHNAKFDMGVLKATLDHYKIAIPPIDFACSVKLSRKVWPALANHKLNTVGAYLGHQFRHHYALDDAEVCAQIVIAAAKERGAESLPDLLENTGVPLEHMGLPTVDTSSAKQEPEQMSFF